MKKILMLIATCSVINSAKALVLNKACQDAYLKKSSHQEDSMRNKYKGAAVIVGGIITYALGAPSSISVTATSGGVTTAHESAQAEYESRFAGNILLSFSEIAAGVVGASTDDLAYEMNSYIFMHADDIGYNPISTNTINYFKTKHPHTINPEQLSTVLAKLMQQNKLCKSNGSPLTADEFVIIVADNAKP